MTNKLNRFITPIVGAALLALSATGIAPAQDVPSYATPATGHQIKGRITAITGKYSLLVRDNRGYIDNVALHQGTVINPTGITLQPGMSVTIDGANTGAIFAANQIDTPYTVALVQGYPYAYPSFGFGLGWGGYGWGGYGWSGVGFRGGLGYGRGWR